MICFQAQAEYLCHTQQWKPSAFQIGKVNHHKHLGLNPYISSQWLTMDFSASAKSGLMVLWHSGRELEY